MIAFVTAVTLAAAAAPTPVAPAAAPAPVAVGRVARVVVFPDRAQVTREASVACGAQVPVRFAALPPAADGRSVRAAVSVGAVDGLRVEEHPLKEAFAPKVRELEAALEKEGAAQQALREDLQRSSDAHRVAGRYRDLSQQLLGREMLDPAGRPAAWDAALDRVQAAQLLAVKEQARLGAALRRGEQRLMRLREELQVAGAESRRSELLADVVVTCPRGQTAVVGLSYLVGGVGWIAAHEARLSEEGSGAPSDSAQRSGAPSIDSAQRSGAPSIEITTYGTVEQRTGEDWTAAALVLSTAVPQRDATPPEVAPLRIYGAGVRPKARVVVSRTEQRAHAEESGAATAPTEGDGWAAGGRARAQGLSVQFAVPGPATIPGDGTPSRLVLARASQKTQLKLRSAPKLYPGVFRVADLVNTAPYPLLAGRMDLFRRGGYVGGYDLDRVPGGGRFTLSFGVEESVKITRAVLEEAARDRGLLGPTRRRRYAYRYEVASYLPAPAEIEIAEHVPVSEVADIRVGLDPATSAGYALEAQDGIVRFRPVLRRGEQKILQLRYYVDVPQSYDAGD